MHLKTFKININDILIKVKELPIELKIAEISKCFLGIPYEKNTLSGSPENKEEFVVNFEGVDCMTFIEYVEALRLSEDLNSFIENLKNIRYFYGIVDFKKRRHFFTDWQDLKSIKDVTEEIAYGSFSTVIKNLKFIESIEPKLKVIKYIPSEAIEKILSNLKTGDYCGFYTSRQELDVIHVGIIIIEGNNVKLRHASSIKGYVVDEDFLEYTKQKEGLIILRPQEI